MPFWTTLAQPTLMKLSWYNVLKGLLLAAKYIQTDATFQWQVSLMRPVAMNK